MKKILLLLAIVGCVNASAQTDKNFVKDNFNKIDTMFHVKHPLKT